ncbi:MAG: isoquinoline 1-oxidoreductase subunit beta [Alphaproteobacteria bacterium]|jgi:isoquinoline 1-oxidoreductase beta subunit|nr:isoquinoline 1-oxidoreductase subunit beta [Alphaproteobacteria bacterium]
MGAQVSSTPGLSRRDFVGGAAGLTLALTLAPDPFGSAAADGPLSPNAWVTIGTDGAVTIVSPAAELGQGSFTALPAIFADELDADWSKVKLVPPPVWDEKTYGNPEYYDNYFQTSASWAVRGYFKALRLAGAQARRVLLDAVAAKWGVPAAELSTEPSVVVHKASGRRMGYGEIAAFAKPPAELPKIDESDLKPASSFRYIGKDVPRADLPDKVTGATRYGIDVQVPGMVYAAVLHVPYQGGAPATIDDAAARRVPGVTDIVRLPDGVGVVGTSVEATQAAKMLLKVTWSDAPGAGYDSERALDAFAEIARDKTRDGTPFNPVGDAKAALQRAAKVYRGEYRTRYVTHAAMEPLNATAAVGADGTSAEIWAGTQGATDLRNQVARLLQTGREKITYHQYFLGGGFGRRGSEQDVVLEAVRLAKAVGKPVKLIWSREEDMAFGKYRPMTAHHIEAGLDAGGKLIAWHHRVAAESVRGYRAAASGVTRPAGSDRIVMFSTSLAHYSIPHKLAEHLIQPHHARLSTLRGVGVGHNAFAIESFLDEIAKDVGKDPIDFRLEITAGNPRLQTLLRTVAEMSDWKRKRDGTALGVAVMEKDETQSAGVAEVSVDRASGKIKVHNFWCAIDAGIAVQPRNLAAQTEGSIVWGLGQVLREKITIKDGRVQQSNYSDYEVARMSDMPNIEVKVVSTDHPPTGAGEDGLPTVAGAVGNAVAALTGVRLRELPFAPDRVRGALGA